MARLRERTHCVLVSHFHWDREWYRTFEDFRSRLVGAIDAVLDLCAADPGYRFVLDGQAVVLEDYFEVRPSRRAEVEAGVRQGRLAVGPWYVQPDSMLPSGEAHVRNLLHGRELAGAVGPVSTVAYVPDSFGHPAQFPQLFAGFGLAPFVYWRGNGGELDRVGPVWRWRAPDGTEVPAWHLTDGYFGAAGLDAEAEVAAERLVGVVERLAAAGHEPVLLMNGFDHLPPDGHTGPVAEALGRRLGAGTEVRRGLLDDAVALLEVDGAGVFEGPLLGARIANQLPGVWSARLPLKLRNRACEAELTGWCEPWAALGGALGLPDERPALRSAWRALLRNQAHDSVGGCSLDRVADQMAGRYDTAMELGTTTTRRVLEQLAGRDVTGVVPFTEDHEVVVCNPSPHARTGVVTAALDGLPPWRVSIERFDLHPLTLQPPDAGWVVDGRPARVVPSVDPARVRFLPDTAALDLEFVVTDVPAFGCRRYRVARGPVTADVVDDGRSVEAGEVAVSTGDDGSLAVTLGGRTFPDLFGLEDQGDRGDSYDFDPVGEAGGPPVRAVSVRRTVSPTGVARLRTEREVVLPVGLVDGDEARADAVVGCRLVLEAVVVPGVPAVDVTVTFDNRARDHRLRLRFPTGAPVGSYAAATTFDAAQRSTAPVDATGWIHPPVRTFPHQGWVAANGLVVGAPGLPEAEVAADGTVLVTLVRSVGWLARFDVRTRPLPAGPEMPAAGAQVQGPVTARVVVATDPSVVRDAELGLRAVLGGPAPRLDAGRSLLSLSPPLLELSACKPAEDGEGFVVRVLNPTGSSHEATVSLGFGVVGAETVRLDETPVDQPLERDGSVLRFPVPAHALRSVRVRPH
jgi:mannosylglycerate hydrolase